MAVLRRLKDHKTVSAHRNEIQYDVRWPYADLYQLLMDPKIGVLPIRYKVDEDDMDHNLKVAQIIAYCSAHMLFDVLSPLQKFEGYCSNLKRRLSPEWHPLLNTGALSDDLRVWLRGQTPGIFANDTV